MNSRIVKSVLCATTAIGLCHTALLPSAAQAQEREIEEVVVTGTLIRGVAPVGSNVIGISREDIEASGVTDSNLLLGTLPQSTFFLTLPEPGFGVQAGIPRIPINVPNLRNLPLGGIPSGNPTLVLMDGHRIVPAGIEQSAVDGGVIPAGILERQEIVLDGTSAIYGTDAVGGVINYIPRKRFDGGQVDASYGFADSYKNYSANATAGWSWASGGFGLSYSFAKSTNIRDRDRDHQRARNYFEGGRDTGTACPGGEHVTTGTGTTLQRFVVNSTGTALRPATAADYCWLGYGDFRPAQENHGGFAAFSQDLSETLRFDATAFYAHRFTRSIAGPFTTNFTVRSTNPYFMSLTAFGIPNSTAQAVSVTFGPVLGYESQYSDTILEMAQVTPTLTWDVGGDWQIKADFVYGKSINAIDQNGADATVRTTNLSGTTRATAINPYDTTLTENQLLIGQIQDFHSRRDSSHKLLQALVKADGPLFSLPGGEVRAAFGGEWTKTDFKKRVTEPTTAILQPYVFSSVNSKAVFGEVVAPIVGPDNRMAGVDSLVFSASGRYDTYAYYGDTFNPKIAVTYDPIDWVSFRANWGKSFRAPNAADRLGSLFAISRIIGCCQPIPAPIYTDPRTLNSLATSLNLRYINLGGAQPDLKPETSKNWTIGVDIEPPVVPGLRLGASYYNIAFRDHINIPNPQTTLTPLFLNVPRLYAINPCVIPTVNEACLAAPRTPAFEAALRSFLNQTTNAQEILDTVAREGYRLAYVVDTRVTNLASFNLAGLDVNMSYTHPTSWGSITARFGGNWGLKSETQLYPNTPVITNNGTSAQFSTSRFRGTFGLGVTYGDFSANASLMHQAGYEILAADLADYVGQTTIDQFDVVNLSFRWNVNGNHPLAQDLSFRLNINNVLDTDPPITYTNSGGTENGSTLGRVIQFGVSKSF